MIADGLPVTLARQGRRRHRHARLALLCFAGCLSAGLASEVIEGLEAARGAAESLGQRLPIEEADLLRDRVRELERAFHARHLALDEELAIELGELLDPDAPARPVFLEDGQRRLVAPLLSPGNSTNTTGCEAEVSSGLGLPLIVSMPVIFVLVMLSGLFSGLTLGLMGLDMVGLQIVSKGDNPALAKAALKIMPIRAKGNQLLCTLLLGNVAVNSALAILMADIADGLMGFIVSTALIVIFGEILPQAACSRYALQVGSCTVPIVQVLMALFFVLTKPMSSALDCLLGREVSTVHSRQELMEMLKLQISLGAVDQATGDMAKQVAEGALSFRDKQVGDVMTPLEDAYMLSFDTPLDYEKIREIFETGYSRVPVYGRDKHDYKGLLYTKDLMLADPEDEMKLGDFIMIFGRKVETFWKTTRLVECLNTFKKGGTHMGLVRKTEESAGNINTIFSILGVLTFEDVMEEILQEEIVDETDVYVDVDNQIKVFGREKKDFDLAVFNPVWRRKQGRLSSDEVNGIVASLSRICFNEDPLDVNGLYLSEKALAWFISVGEVVCRNRITPMAGYEEPLTQDWIYDTGAVTDTCIMVLQGRIAIRVGRERFRSEAGAFTLLAKDALRPNDFCPDFGAFLGTLKVRYLVLTKARYKEAQKLDKQPEALEEAMLRVAEEAKGAVSRKEAREIRNQKLDPLSPRLSTEGSWTDPRRGDDKDYQVL